LAFSKLAQTYANLGYDSEAEQSAQKAVGLSENLPPVEKYLIAAIRAQVANNYSDAIKAYENMAKASPANADVQSALARLYEDTGDFAKAGEFNQKLLAANPKDIIAIVATGRVAINSGDPRASLDPLNRSLTLSIQLENDEERGTSLHLMGVAYRMLNKPEEALRNFQEALAIRRRIGQKRGIAFSLNEMAVVEESLGKPKDALVHYQEALQIRREIGDKRGLGDTLIDLGDLYDARGDHDQALKMYKEALQFERDIGDEGLQAACLNNIGSAHFSKNEYQDALTYFQQALQLREKSKVPQDIVESVHNLAETSARMGQYDQAVTQYMRALDLRRSMDDSRGRAIESYSMGTLFDYQGRFGAAINSKQDALKAFRDLKDRTFWMAEILGGHAEALTLAGRGEESRPYLLEALNLSRELRNDGLVAQTLAFQGDVSYYRGDMKSARSYYQGALQAAVRTKEPDKVLIAKADLARVDIEEGHAAAAIKNLRSLARQAEDQGFAYMAVECSIYMAEAMVRTHDDSHARQELERALLRADKLGLKPLSAKAHYLLATTLRASGKQAEAQQHYRDALQLLDAMRKEPGADKILQRSDFKAIYDEASRWSQAAKS
jgi:tetratricopeptide (TPR) repeat protein